MRSWLHLVLIWCGLVSTVTAFAADPPGAFSDEARADSYDCVLTLSRDDKASAKSGVRLLLEWDANTPYLRVSLQSQAIVIEQVDGRKVTRIGSAPYSLKAGQQQELTILRRGSWLGLLREKALLFRGQAPRAAGTQAGMETDTGWTVEDARLQTLEPVAFSDNFMRTADEAGNWTTQSGAWALQSAWDNDPHRDGNAFSRLIYAQNPFAWVGRNPNGSALCTAGEPFWEDYTFSAAVRPQANAAVGMAVNMTDAKNGLLVRWSPITDQGPEGNTLLLYHMTNGVTTLLGKDRGGYIPGQWYTLTVVSSLDGVRVLVDGRERLAAKDVTPWRGGVGLYAEGTAGAIFDDVTVYGRTLKKDLIAETQMTQINQRFLTDRNGMREWSDSDWVPFPAVQGQWAHRWDFFGDHWVSLVVKPVVGATGQLWLGLQNDGASPTSGYRITLESADDGKQTRYRLFRDTTEIASKTTEALKPDTEYTLRLWHMGARLWFDVDGETIFETTDESPVTGMRPMYRAEGIFSRVRDAVAMGRNVRNYLFADAPVDWLDEGVWMPTTRWACAPQWSFLGGWSRGDAVLWHKQRFTGDQLFQAYVGLKMEYPRERDIYDNRYRDFGVTICGDGHDPRSGYTGIYGAPDSQGKPNTMTVLLRNGQEVASIIKSVPGRGNSHRDWFDLALQKKGRTVTFYVEGQPVLTYEDPEPITGGVPAIWTTDNGIALARARMHYAEPPQLRTDPWVAIDEPWYPEWGNVGRPVILDFPSACATSGASVQLNVTPHIVQAGQHTPPAAVGRTVSFTPTAIGEYWYDVTATDGQQHSPAFHLSLPVFDPALRRDDAHALLLYRFDEGQGKTVRDRSAVTPAIDLTIPKGSTAQWVPGQGLWVNGIAPLMSARGAEKLMGIAKQRACTLEFWVSTDTVYPLTGWSGCLLSWELGADKRNLAIGHSTANLLLAPQGSGLEPQNPGVVKAGGFRTSLQHYVAVWDGTKTLIYRNGKKMTEATVPWTTERWTPDAPLIFGNQADGIRAYVGTYYLVAIHDIAMRDEQVLRHYQAGPSAR